MIVTVHGHVGSAEPIEVRLSPSILRGDPPNVLWRFGPPLDGITIGQRVEAGVAGQLRELAATLIGVADEIDRLPPVASRA